MARKEDQQPCPQCGEPVVRGVAKCPQCGLLDPFPRDESAWGCAGRFTLPILIIGFIILFAAAFFFFTWRM